MEQPPIPPVSRAEIAFTDADTSVLKDARVWCRSLVPGPSGDVELVLNELLANAIEHGAPERVDVSLELYATGCAVAVTNRSAPPPPNMDSIASGFGPKQARGRGLLIAAKTASHLQIDQKGDALRIEAFLHRPGKAELR